METNVAINTANVEQWGPYAVVAILICIALFAVSKYLTRKARASLDRILNPVPNDRDPEHAD